MANTGWNEGEPTEEYEYGYFLVAWRYAGGQRIYVSEMWFNSDAIVHWWWTRGYTGLPALPGMQAAFEHVVVAWRTMPTLSLTCEVCGGEGRIGVETGEHALDLGRLDLSVNDHEIVHRKCWARDPEAQMWTPLNLA